MLSGHFDDANVCVVGLGYVGLTLGVALADVGFRIVGIEKNTEIIETIRKGKAHFFERELDQLLSRQVQDGQFDVSSKMSAGKQCSVYIITVGTPVTADKRIELEGIVSVAEAISAHLKQGDMVILRSTVKSGTTRDVVKPILDRAGVSYDLAFCPERTLEGKALFELRTLPQIVGGVTDRATLRAAQLFSFLTPTIIRVSDPETAEIAKLVNNTQRDYYFAFANEVAAVCESLGISASEVISACNRGYDRSRIPMPGPVGGPCLEKDPYILADSVALKGGNIHLSLAARRWNETLPEWTVRRIVENWKAVGGANPRRIALLGLAFKGQPETNDLRGTVARPVIQELKRAFPGIQIVGFDPMVSRHETLSLGIEAAASIAEALAGASIAVIQTNHDDFGRMHLGAVSAPMERPALIYDYWSQYARRTLSLPADVHYLALGEPRMSTARSDGKG